MLRSEAERQMNEGYDEEAAVLMALNRTNVQRVRDYNAAGERIDRTHECYWSEIYQWEFRLRTSALPLTEADEAFLAKHHPDARVGDRLGLYTKYVHGPRLYFYDRMKAWQAAAEGPP